MSVVTKPSFSKAVSAIVSANPEVKDDEARRVLTEVAGLASVGKLPDAFIEFVIAGRPVAEAGNNACGGGNNACGAASE